MTTEMFNTADDLVAGLRRRDPDAVAAALGRYQHRLYRFLLRVVNDPAAAEDLFQQTWLRVIEKIERYDARRSFDAWIFSVAHHLAIDYLRRRRGLSLDLFDECKADHIDPSSWQSRDALQQLLEYERGKLVAAAVAELSAIHREVLSLRFEEEMKLNEIAEVLAVPLSTVKSRLSRAMEHLRVILESRLSGGAK